MSGIRAIAVGADHYVPTFEVYLAGRPLERRLMRDVVQVTYHDHLEELDGFSLTVTNWDADALCFTYSEGDELLPGKPLELWLGYRGGLGLRPVIRGQISELTPTFPSSGTSTLAITGQSSLAGLQRRQECRRYPGGQLVSDIFMQIAKFLAVEPVVDPGDRAVAPPLDELVQHNEYDIVFLLRLARRTGYDLVLEEPPSGKGRPRLHLRPGPVVGTGELELGYRGTGRNPVLIEFNPTFSTDRQTKRVVVQGWSLREKRKIKVVAERVEVPPADPPGFTGAIKGAVEGRDEVLVNHPISDEAEALRLARSTMARIKQRMITATGRTIGHPDLRAGIGLQIVGVGQRFSGRYVVTSSEHSLGPNGYTTGFSCRREEVSGG